MSRKVMQRFDWSPAALPKKRSLVTAVGADTREMSHQLAYCHRPLFLRECGHIRLNLVVELQTAFLQQPADRGRSEHGGGSANPEPRFGRDGRPFLQIRPAKAFRPHDVATD